MKKNSVFIGKWLYSKPDLLPDKDGNIVLISKASVGPMEIYQWGIDSNNIPYESYKWLEDDYFKETSYFMNITKEELLNEINSTVSLFRSNGLSEWADTYEKIIEKQNFD